MVEKHWIVQLDTILLQADVTKYVMVQVYHGPVLGISVLKIWRHCRAMKLYQMQLHIY